MPTVGFFHLKSLLLTKGSKVLYVDVAVTRPTKISTLNKLTRVQDTQLAATVSVSNKEECMLEHT